MKDKENHWKICGREDCNEILDLEEHNYRFNICETCHHLKYIAAVTDKIENDDSDSVIENNPNTGAPVISVIGAVTALCAMALVFKK